MVSLIANTYDANKIECLELGNIEIDVTRTESHSFRNEIARMPVEKGVDVTDSVKQYNPVLKLTGICSNTPIFYTGPQTTDNATERLIRQDFTNRVQQTFNYLLMCSGNTPTKQGKGESLQKKNQPRILTIVTGLMIYRDMVISDIEVPRHSKSGDGLEFNLTLEQIKMVSSKYENRPVVVGKAPNTDKKIQVKKEAGKKETPEPEKSLSVQILDTISAWGK